MSVFRNHKTSGDRSASDRSRHKEKIKKAIRDGVYDIVSNESIIGQDGKKKIKIPVRGIKEYRFVYGDNNKKVGSAPGKNIKSGQTISKTRKKKESGSGKPGNEKGEEFYEVEITLEELSYYLFDSLNLPDLEKKKLKKLLGDKKKRKGYRSSGIRPRLSKKETLKNKIKRVQATKRQRVEGEDDETYSFHQNDLKYRHIKDTRKENSNAAIFFIMDTSGSMTQHKKFLSRSFFFLLYHFLRHRYENTELVFISHSVDAKEVNEDDFFKKGSSGGTIVSSALNLCLDIVSTRFHPEHWNIYAFHCSDGDNWPEDNDKAVTACKKLTDLCQLNCFIQVCPDTSNFWSDGGMANVYNKITGKRFKVIHLEKPDHIWPEFKRLFGGFDV
jgi:sporulation protein YhbH